jgi:hypothetical protein
MQGPGNGASGFRRVRCHGKLENIGSGELFRSLAQSQALEVRLGW